MTVPCRRSNRARSVPRALAALALVLAAVTAPAEEPARWPPPGEEVPATLEHDLWSCEPEAPWLAGGAWTLDYAEGRLLRHPKPPAPPAGSTVAPGVDPPGDGEGLLTISVRVDGEALALHLDPGASEPRPPAFGEEVRAAVSEVSRALADRWRAGHPEWMVVGVGAAGLADDGEALPGGYWILAPEVEVAGRDGGLPVGPVWFVTRPDAGSRETQERRVDGALGGNALRGLRVTLDPAGGRAILVRPGPEPGRADLDAMARARTLSDLGFRAYQAGHHAEAGRLMERVAETSGETGDGHYNAACSFALAGPEHRERALGHLRAAVGAGLRSADRLERDPDLESLRDDPAWPKLIAGAEANARRFAEERGDPAKARVVTDDLERFWSAFDEAAGAADAEEAARVYRRLYLEPGSPGLLAFYGSRIGSAEDFTRVVEGNRPYYDAVRPQLRLTAGQEAAIRASFARLEELYPDAVFPPIYFLVGRLSSGGTTSSDALLIGTELFGLAPDTPAGVIPESAANMVKEAARIPYIVAHELIHAQQTGGSGGLLHAALREGGADFLADLIQPSEGWEPNYRTWGKAHADAVRRRFLDEKDGESIDAWFYNYSSAGEDWFPDLGYFVGYEIARGYFEAADDEAAAVRDLILLEDPDAILAASGYVEALADPSRVE